MIVAYQGKSLLSRAIQWQTDGDYSHVAWQRRDGTVIGSWWPHGVRVTPDESAGHTPRTLIDLFAVDTMGEDQRALLEGWMLGQIGKPYDWRGVLRFLSRRKTDNPVRWFCSELLMAAFNAAGHPLLLRIAPWQTSPTDLVRSPLLRHVGRGATAAAAADAQRTGA
jgi:uncharacterized protein YycO